jgi:DNA-binding protein H-NS
MAKTYQQIQKQIANLTREAEVARKKEVGGVISRIKTAIDTYGLTAADLGFTAIPKSNERSTPAKRSVEPAKRQSPVAGKKVPVKYRDDAGNAWTGRGNQPRWLKAALSAGRALDDFKI